MNRPAAHPVPPGQHRLPPLPYGYNALEPVIDGVTLQIHHNKHHKAYVDKLNRAELALVQARVQSDFTTVKFWEREIAFNGSGHILHSIFWTILAPVGRGGRPLPETSRMIFSCFGSWEAFQAQFSSAAKEVDGSGWGILVYNPAFARLEILQCEKHENLTQWGSLPLLVCDVWEHAYYLRYRNDRSQFVDCWWQLVNWREVERRLLLARQGDLPLTMKPFLSTPK